MSHRKGRRRAPVDYRSLLCLLNQRYHREFVRAEVLESLLAPLRALRLTWVLSGLGRLRRWLARPPRCVADADWAPLELRPVEPAGRVSLVIPFRDRPELLRDCLASLRLSTYRDYEVVLVDNGSNDPQLLRYLRRLEQRRRCRVVRRPGPFNFPRLCNAGAEQARGDYLLFLNNDTCVLTPDWLEQLLVVASQPGVGIVGATLLYPDGTLQHAGMFRRPDGIWDHFARGRPAADAGAHGELRQVRVVPAVTAACLLIARERFFALGGFDERLAVTHNDTDLCRRARARGLLVAVTPHARLLHYESLSRGYHRVPADREPAPGVSA
jgi:GT2 family glycosyltransferase